MYNALFEKTGIKLTKIQTHILKELISGIIKALVLTAVIFAAGIALNVITPSCAQTMLTSYAEGMHALSCFNQNHLLPDWSPGVIVALSVVVFVPFITGGAQYLGRRLSS